MSSPEVTEITLTLSDGTAVKARRCGLYPDLFATRDGDVYTLNHCTPVYHQGHSNVRYRSKVIATRFLIADAWQPNWQDDYETVKLYDEKFPMDVSIDNLELSKDRRRGRPRSETMAIEIHLARVAMACNDIEMVADECNTTPKEVFEAVLKWFPEALVDMSGVPEEFLKSNMHQSLQKRAEAIKHRRELRAAERRANLKHP